MSLRAIREELLEELRATAGVERVSVVERKLPAKIWDILELGLAGLADRVSPSAGLERGLDWMPLEPGLYYLGLGGVRIEDMALVRKKNSRCLTRVPKQLEV